MDKKFRDKFYLDTAKGVSGGRIANIRLNDEFVSVAEKTAKKPGYTGQVVSILLGTNDWAQPHVTEEDFECQYRTLVDRLLAIPHTAVVMTGLVPRHCCFARY